MNQIYTLYHLIFVVKIKIIMKVSILGNSLTSLTLAKLLVNQDIRVDIYSFGKIIKKIKYKLLNFKNKY